MMHPQIDAYIMAQEGLQALDRSVLEQLQLTKLNHVLQRMRAHGNTHLPERLDTLAALADLPFTTADMLAESPSRFLLSSQADIARIITDRTSGTTAAAKRVFYTEEDVESTIQFFAAGISEMVQAGETVLITMPFSGTLGLGDLIKKAVEKIGAQPLCAGWGKSYAELSALVLAHRPQCYIGFPVPLLSLARYMGDAFSVERALISGDVCSPGVFAVLSEQFALYPHYGSREMCLGGAITCHAQLTQAASAFQGMHMRENHFIAEIIGENGLPLPDGQEGELVITTIGMTAMPLLRYRTGDRTHIIAEPDCPCHSVTKRIAQPFRMGEDNALLYAFDDAIFAVPEVVDYRVERVGQTLHIQALCTSDCEQAIRQCAQIVFPEVVLTSTICEGRHTALYPGKRKLIEKEATP